MLHLVFLNGNKKSTYYDNDLFAKKFSKPLLDKHNLT